MPTRDPVHALTDFANAMLETIRTLQLETANVLNLETEVHESQAREKRAVERARAMSIKLEELEQTATNQSQALRAALAETADLEQSLTLDLTDGAVVTPTIRTLRVVMRLLAAGLK